MTIQGKALMRAEVLVTEQQCNSSCKPSGMHRHDLPQQLCYEHQASFSILTVAALEEETQGNADLIMPFHACSQCTRRVLAAVAAACPALRGQFIKHLKIQMH